jgi:hemerythrin-like domain-containing protein
VDESFNLINADPLSVLFAGRTLQYRICDDLELLADQLGGLVDVALCCGLARRLQSVLPVCHRNEEALFEFLTSTGAESSILTACADLASSQHETMQAYVHELMEPLTELSAGIKPRSLDTVGYMLRHCFDGMRDHLGWEDASLFSEAAMKHLQSRGMR